MDLDNRLMDRLSIDRWTRAIGGCGVAEAQGGAELALVHVSPSTAGPFWEWVRL
ncbi:hypothetical protein Snoj_33330 [Streptomyces nojiriensis]|uniref:GNAT family N-acetyltransferase n=1 Tax=Streptomyces nojiriensis TaxID=66374 RepID=A0ABQ3SMR0_9ACTN|nr:hypothetical protein [Streptomyces nojiriensis]GGS32819.1 hypothetical protein GCM10010205_73680 [Streptomyces nojiriensis]GHI69415.1 hypothetical protein Snoj_33330 [Streptomyces nojiriensis]